MKKRLLIAIPILIALAFAFRHFPENLTPAPAIPDTGTTTEKVTIAPAIDISPRTVLQGDPARITIEGVDRKQILSLVWQGAALPLIEYKDKPTALIGIDLRKATGVYPLTLKLSDGTEIKKDVVVTKREIATAPLGIPDKLGGNTPQAATNLVSTLAEENAVLSSIRSDENQLWHEAFAYPLKGEIVITDEYGYTRSTVNTSISHKGTDFRAAVGTPVYAMNSGSVALAREFRNYGNTVVIDHGLGVQTLYMHLSEILVKQGDNVIKGQLIGKSGMTGYAEFPHLHISVKIGGISIDPVQFLDLF